MGTIVLKFKETQTEKCFFYFIFILFRTIIPAYTIFFRPKITGRKKGAFRGVPGDVKPTLST